MIILSKVAREPVRIRVATKDITGSEAMKMLTRARTTPHLQRCGNRSTIVMIQVRGAGEYG